MSVSPIAEIYRQGFRQSCTVYTYGGADPTGQPVYNTGVTYPCRIAVRTKRTLNADGDYVTNTDTTFLLPPDAGIQAQDRIDLPSPYQRGAVVREVATAFDWLGRVTHLVVRIA